MFGATAIAAVSLAAAIAVCVALVLPAWPIRTSVEGGPGLDQLWRDGYWKQVSGFTLLGLSAAAALLSVRKRVKLRRLGEYRFWRIAHVALGLLMLAVLFLHTGFRLGSNLNFWLLATFLAVVTAGAMTGVATAREHSLLDRDLRSPRPLFAWLHVLAFWPLPLLLLLHVVSGYAY